MLCAIYFRYMESFIQYIYIYFHFSSICAVEVAADRCSLERRAGTASCRANLVRYYFDAEVGGCQEFIYGGCGGNENRFETRDECESECRHFARRIELDANADLNKNKYHILTNIIGRFGHNSV